VKFWHRLPERLKRITVYNKIDLSGVQAERHDESDGTAISLSARSGEGIELLRNELLKLPAGTKQMMSLLPANAICALWLRSGTYCFCPPGC
jgi:50S ribosomal subunit-associated GTPase HflX